MTNGFVEHLTVEETTGIQCIKKAIRADPKQSLVFAQDNHPIVPLEILNFQ